MIGLGHGHGHYGLDFDYSFLQSEIEVLFSTALDSSPIL